LTPIRSRITVTGSSYLVAYRIVENSFHVPAVMLGVQ